MLHHVCDEHEWCGGKCDHSALQREDIDKEPMMKGSPPHQALKHIALNSAWLESMPYYVRFR